MDSAEQAALSEESSQSQSSQTRFYASRFTDYASDAKHDKDLLLKPTRRFDKLSVNLSLSSILVPSGVDDTKGNVELTMIRFIVFTVYGIE